METFKPCGELALNDKKQGKPPAICTAEAINRCPADLWCSVVFSDENIVTTDLAGRVRVTRPRGTRHEERFAVTKDSSGRDSVALLGLDRWPRKWRDPPHRRTPHRHQLRCCAGRCAAANTAGYAARGRAICFAVRQCSPAYGAADQGLARRTP